MPPQRAGGTYRAVGISRCARACSLFGQPDSPDLNCALARARTAAETADDKRKTISCFVQRFLPEPPPLCSPMPLSPKPPRRTQPPRSDEGARRAESAAPSTPPGRRPIITRQEEQKIVVTGFARNRARYLVAAHSVLCGDDLDPRHRPTIGDTLARQPGVSATSFGPNASRPVLRGFQGDRVAILTDGIGSLDVSSASADHAVAINPLTADRIEVLRGPRRLAVRLLGDRRRRQRGRFAHSAPRPGRGRSMSTASSTYGSAADERSGNAAIDVPLGGHFVVHVDGNYSKTDDLEIGGFVLTPALRAQAAASPDPDIRGLADLRGRLPNSAARDLGRRRRRRLDRRRQQCRLFGQPLRQPLRRADPLLARSGDRGRGAAHRHRTRPASTAAPRSTPASGFLDFVRLRGGWSDYRHFELEEDGAIGTRLLQRRLRGPRRSAANRPRRLGRRLRRAIFQPRLRVDGDEKFLPPNLTRPARPVHAADARSRRVQGRGRPALRAFIASRRCRCAIIGNPALQPQLRCRLRLGRRQLRPRARPAVRPQPVAQRARALGRGIVRQRPPCRHPERSRSAIPISAPSGAGASRRPCAAPATRFSFSASIFQSWFDGYIYETPTGAIQDDLPVFQYLPGRRPLFRRRVRGLGSGSPRSATSTDQPGRRRRLCPRDDRRRRPRAAYPAAATARRDRGAVRPASTAASRSNG